MPTLNQGSVPVGLAPKTIFGIAYTIFSKSTMKRSKTFMPLFQKSDALTFRSKRFPISNGDKLLPADNAFTSLGTKVLPSFKYCSYRA